MTLVGLLLAACGVPEPPRARPGTIEPSGPVAFVADGVEVPSAAFDALLARIPRDQSRRLAEEGRTTDFVEHVALTQALYRRALDAGIDADPSVALALAMSQREVLASEFVRREARRRVTPEAVAARYAEMAELRVPQLRVRHLRLPEDVESDALLQRLRAGAPFAELAREASADAGSADEGGDLGWLDASVVAETFGHDVANAAIGAVLGPVRASVGGAHLVVVEGRRDAIPLEEIEAGLTAAMQAEAMEAVTEECRAAMRIERP